MARQYRSPQARGGEALHMQCSTKEEDKRQLGAVGLIRRKDDAFFMGECLLN